MLEKEKNRRFKLIEEIYTRPFEVGEKVYVERGALRGTSDKFGVPCEIVEIDGDKVRVAVNEYSYSKDEYVVNKEDCKRDIHNVGFNPFPVDDWHKRVRSLQFDNEAILYALFPEEYRGQSRFEYEGHPMSETNLNPYVIGKDGEKLYFQRPLVWTLEQKQALIDSIYNGINCGQILVKTRDYLDVERAFKNGDYDTCFKDVVDGKQRVTTLLAFVRDEFPDSHGWYFTELSPRAQHEFLNRTSFTYSEIGEGATDDDVLMAFLSVNFTGVPQSVEHIKYVESLRKKI